MEWGVPKNLIWLWLLAALAGIFWLASTRKKARLERFGDLKLVERLLMSLSPSKRLVKRILLILAVVFIVLTLGQPHFRKKETLVERKGIDVMIAVDVSQSMLATDIAPSRLEKAKLELADLIDKLKGDRIGIVAFAGEALIQCPLTLDKNAVKLFLSTVSPNLIPYQGTSLSRAILASLKAYPEKEKEHKALVLLTDGEDHESEVAQAVVKAKESGLRIFAVGIGTPDGSTLPAIFETSGYLKDNRGEVVLSKINEPLLRDIAGQTGGTYYRSTRGELEVDRLVRDLDRISTKDLRREWSVEYEENFQFLLVIAFVLLCLEMVLSERKTGWVDGD